LCGAIGVFDEGSARAEYLKSARMRYGLLTGKYETSGKWVTQMSERQGMRPTTLAGFLVVAGIGIGALLSSILPDLPFGIGTGWMGLGNRSGTTKSESDTKSETDDKTKSNESPIEELPPATQKTSETGVGSVEIQAPPVIYVLIHGRDYLLRNGPEDKVSQRPAKLDEVIEAARQTTGDENGIRVRIYQTVSAKTLALNALLEQLEAAEIPRGAIRAPDAPLDE